MGLRPGRCYTKMKKPYTRISVSRPRRSYVKGVPPIKIHQFEMGAKGNYSVNFYLVSKKDVQIRSNALEAARIISTSYLIKKLGETAFFLKVLVYPHQILRENAIATGAGADRFSQGMRMSFGKPIGQAARVRKGQRVLFAQGSANSEEVIKTALERSSKKLPGSYRIVAG